MKTVAVHPAIVAYFNDLRQIPVADATEHSPRPYLHTLLQTVLAEQDSKFYLLHEPKRDKAGRGSPDFKISHSTTAVGYLENKKIEENLDETLKSAQIQKYRTLSNNLLLTNYLDWKWLRDGKVVREVSLCGREIFGSRTTQLNPEKAAALLEMLHGFASQPAEQVGKAKVLAEILATNCKILKEFITEELKRQADADERGQLYGLYQTFFSIIFGSGNQALDEKEETNARNQFADTFAQMLGYGLFLAKLNADTERVTLKNAEEYIPAAFELIRELVHFLRYLEQPEYADIRWVLENILETINRLDLVALRHDLSFKKELFKPTEEERLFAKDPYIYFYEDFLRKYDAKTKEARGQYYTPPPVVNFIIRGVNDILKRDFGIAQGLADPKRVTLLDFATGTGTFLLEVFHQVLGSLPEGSGKKDALVRDHLLQNMYGFEFMMAPYTIAHLKLSQFLKEQADYTLGKDERIQVYLTNTLEPPHATLANYMTPATSKEAQQAKRIKEKKILVITGNPPYSGHSANKGPWITGLIDDYRRDFPDLSRPGQGKWLQDDYVKFFRFAQERMRDVDEGIVAVITNHGFLDNSTFKGMRKSLMEAFSQIYLLNLHGDLEKKEYLRSPTGVDDNVFAIKKGVAIALLIKHPKLPQAVRYAEVWGKQLEKYHYCAEQAMESIQWQELAPQTGDYMFVPRDNDLAAHYEVFWHIPAIFNQNGSPAPGIVTTHDEFAISFTAAEAAQKVEKLLTTTTEAEARQHFRLCSQTQWNYGNAKTALANGEWKQQVVPVAYRPFDTRFTVYNPHVAVHRRERVNGHMIDTNNLALMTTKKVEAGDFQHAIIYSTAVESHSVSMKEINYAFPLYVHSLEGQGTLLNTATPNLSPEFMAELREKYGTRPTPEQVLGYIYAVLHSPTYRTTYQQFLKTDFPRIPLVEDKATFEALSTLGWGLVEAHLLRQVPALPLGDFMGQGDNVVQGKPRYSEAEQRLYINPSQYFQNVPPEVWAFHIGGYPVLEQYLKARKDRTLTLDEATHLEQVIKVLAFTHAQMTAIDKAWVCP